MIKERKSEAPSLNYEAPAIKVVSFTVEQGFAGSPFKTATTDYTSGDTPSPLGTETVSDGGSLFPTRSTQQ